MKILPTILTAYVPAAVFGLHVLELPMTPTFADTEVTTNIPVNVFRPGWACRSSWNLMRLTRRGTDMPAECFDVSFRYNVLHFIFR